MLCAVWTSIVLAQEVASELIKYSVIGEAEIHSPNPETYFDVFDTYVNREVTEDGWPPESSDEVGKVYGLTEGIDRVIALKLFTHKSSEFLMADTKVGSLEIGKLHDFIVVEKSYLSGPDQEIRDNKVVMTVLSGDIVYQDPEYNVATYSEIPE